MSTGTFGRYGLALLFAASVACACWPALAQKQRPAPPGLQPPRDDVRTADVAGFSLTAPPANAVLPEKSAVTLQWSGGVTSWKVNLSLVDVSGWVVAAVVGNNVNNSGSRQWTFPPSLGCNKVYQFYIEEVNLQTWHYGPKFTLQCLPPAYDIQLVKTKPGPNSNYKLTVVNAGTSAINGPAKIVIKDDVPGGIKVTGGNASGPGWSMVPSAPQVGPKQLTITHNIPAGTTIAPGATIGWFVIHAAVEIQKNCAQAQLLVNNNPVSESDTANNKACEP